VIGAIKIKKFRGKESPSQYHIKKKTGIINETERPSNPLNRKK